MVKIYSFDSQLKKADDATFEVVCFLKDAGKGLQLTNNVFLQKHGIDAIDNKGRPCEIKIDFQSITTKNFCFELIKNNNSNARGWATCAGQKSEYILYCIYDKSAKAENKIRSIYMLDTACIQYCMRDVLRDRKNNSFQGRIVKCHNPNYYSVNLIYNIDKFMSDYPECFIDVLLRA